MDTDCGNHSCFDLVYNMNKVVNKIVNRPPPGIRENKAKSFNKRKIEIFERATEAG